MSFTLRAKRLLIGAATGALVLGLFPAGAAFAGQAEVCANAPDAGFTDVAAGGTHTANINCMAAYGVGQGRTDGSYGVFANLTRGQAATLFVNFALAATDGAIADQIGTAPVPFTDIAGTTHEANIQALYRLGLIQGTTATTFGPNAAITRGQFATILRNAHEAFGIDFEANPANQFSDVAGTTHAQAINQLAVAGIISGRADGTYAPNANVARGATATLLAASAGVLDDAGLWEADRLPAPSNQTFTVTPQDVATLTVATPDDASDDRVYTVTNPVAATTHRIELFDADLVSVSSNGTVTFTGGAGNATTGTPAAVISVVNGTATGGVAAANAAPVGGQITFTIDGTGFGSVVPVVYFDANASNGLTIDANGLPVAAEPFGLGGVTNYLPVEAALNAPAADAIIRQVDKDANSLVAGAGADARLYNYDSNDLFYLGSVNPANQLTLAGFEAILTVGDELLAATLYNPTPEFVSTFVLNNIAPPAPVFGGAAPAERSITVTLTGITAGATVNWYYKADAAASADPAAPALDGTFTKATFTADEDPVAAGFQATITGLTPNTNYQHYFTQTVDGEESPATGADAATLVDAVPAVADVIANDINDGIGSTNQIRVTFTEAVTVTAANGFTVTTGGFTLTGTSATQANTAGTQWIVTLDTTMNDATPDVTYTVNVAANSFRDAGGQQNVAATPADTFAY